MPVTVTLHVVGKLIVIIAVMMSVAVVVVLLAVVLRPRLQSRSATDPKTADDAMPDPPARRPIDPPAPMTGLESALAQATDRSGRPMREVIDDETTHVDDLRVPDDTGPLLRRALDHVAEPRERAAADQLPDDDEDSGAAH
jgi:hypothetical protein